VIDARFRISKGRQRINSVLSPEVSMRAHRAIPALFAAAFSMAALVVSPSFVEAQPREGPCPEHCGRGDPAAHLERRLQHLTQKLGLDARQVSRIRAIFQDSAQRRQAVRTLPRGSDQRQRAREDLRTWTRARIRTVLTPAQQTTFDQLRAERRRQHQDGRGRRRGRGSRSDV
jgi:Spy/CpxP family protein refolding chaperone